MSDSAEMYDPERDSWRNVAPMSTKRAWQSAATWKGKVVVAGGQDAHCKTLNSAEQYDPETNQWTPFRSLLLARWGHALVNADNTLLAIGGVDGESWRSVERYNADSGEWEQAPQLNKGRRNFASVTLQVCNYS